MTKLYGDDHAHGCHPQTNSYPGGCIKKKMEPLAGKLMELSELTNQIVKFRSLDKHRKQPTRGDFGY